MNRSKVGIMLGILRVFRKPRLVSRNIKPLHLASKRRGFYKPYILRCDTDLSIKKSTQLVNYQDKSFSKFLRSCSNIENEYNNFSTDNIGTETLNENKQKTNNEPNEQYKFLYNLLQRQFMNSILKNNIMAEVISPLSERDHSAASIYKTIFKYNREEQFGASYELFMSWSEEYKTEDTFVELLEEMMTVAQRLRKQSLAERVFEGIKKSQESEGKSPHIKIYNQLLDIYARLKQVEKANYIWREIKSYNNLSPDEYSYCAMCLVYRNANRKDDLLNMYREAKTNNRLTSSVFSIVLSYNLSWNDLREVVDDLSKSAEIHPFNFSSVVIRIAESKMNELDRFVQPMQRNTYMDTRCFEALIYFYEKRNYLKRAKKVFMNMLQNRMKPTPFGMSSFINILGSMKMEESLFEISSKLLGIDMSTDLFQKDDVLKSLQASVEVSIFVQEISVEVLNPKSPDHRTIQRLTSLDLRILVALMSSLTKVGQEPLAISMFCLIRNHYGRRLTNVIYNCVINALSRMGYPDYIEMVVVDMMHNGIKSCVITYTTWIKGYAMSMNLNKCREILLVMTKNNVSPDAVVLSLLIKAHQKSNSKEQIQKLKRVMAKLPQTPLVSRMMNQL